MGRSNERRVINASKTARSRFLRELQRRSKSSIMSGKQSVAWLQQSLEVNDPEVHQIIRNEKERQRCGLELIASENFASKAVLEAMGSCLNDKYSEGYPVALGQAQTEQFVEYQKQVMKNANALSDRLIDLGYHVVTGGTDNHLLLVNLANKGLDGNRAEKVLEAVHIACNKNTCPGDKSALRPSGLRFGTPALTTRGFMEDDFVKVADLIDNSIEITTFICSKLDGGAKAPLKSFKAALATDAEVRVKVDELGARVHEFAHSFPIPGHQLL